MLRNCATVCMWWNRFTLCKQQCYIGSIQTRLRLSDPENIDRFLEAKSFLRSYDSAPPPPPSPLSRQKVVSLSQSSCVAVELSDGKGGGGRGAKSNDREKAWPPEWTTFLISVLKTNNLRLIISTRFRALSGFRHYKNRPIVLCTHCKAVPIKE